MTSHVFLKQFGETDHQQCILAADIGLKKVHPQKFIKIRKALDNAEENFKTDFANLELTNKIDPSPHACADKSYSTTITYLQSLHN